MKTLIASLIGLGLLTGAANAQYLRFIGPTHISPEICAPGVIHQSQPDFAAPKVAEAPAAQPEQPAEAAPEEPAEAAPEQPAPQAPLPPK